MSSESKAESVLGCFLLCAILFCFCGGLGIKVWRVYYFGN